MSQKFRVLLGIAAIWLGLMMFMGMGRRARMMHAYQHAEAAEYFEDKQAFREAMRDQAGVEGDSAETAHVHQHHHGRHHRGIFGLIGGLFRLALLGLFITFILTAIRKRRGSGKGQMKSQPADEDLSQEIRVGDEINRDDEPATPVNTDDLTVDDLLHAMKRLGIKKLEL